MKVAKIALSVFLVSGVLLEVGCSGPALVGSVAGAAGTTAIGSSGISMGQHVDDQVTKSRIDELLLKIPQTTASKTNLSVTVYNQRVLLLGQVPTQSLKKQIADEISKLPNVTTVTNQLVVGPKQTVEGFLHDTWITAAVKGNMVGHINPFRYKIITEKGIVYLMGRVTKADSQQAASIASHTKDVKKVVTLFQIIPNYQDKTNAHDNPKNKQKRNAVQNNSKNNDQKIEQSHQGNYQVGSNASN